MYESQSMIAATPSTSLGTVRWVTPLLCIIWIPPSWALDEYNLEEGYVHYFRSYREV